MARPIKEGLDYFPLDVDIDQDDKFAMIEALHGIEGFGVAIKLLMKIYKEGYFYEWTNREQILFSKRVNVNINRLNEIVNDCINEGLFNKNIFEQHGVLTSAGIQRRYLEAVKRRKEVSFLKKYFLLCNITPIMGTSQTAVLVVDDNGNGVNVNINPRSNGENVNISTQRKVKQSREKKNILQHTDKTENPFSFYQQNFGVLSPFMSEDIGQWSDDMGEGLVIEAMKIALKGQKSWNYAAGILKEWSRKNVKTVDEARALSQKKPGTVGAGSKFDGVNIGDE